MSVTLRRGPRDGDQFEVAEIGLNSGQVMIGQSDGFGAKKSISGAFTLSPEGVATETQTRFLSQTVTLTNAEILALRAAPKTIIPGQGSGSGIVFHRAVLKFTRVGAYTETDDNLAFRYTDGSGALASDAIETTGFVDAAANAFTFARPKVDGLVLSTALANAPLVLHNTGDGEFGGGDAGNSLSVTVYYGLVNIN